jgi:hypothetical protein
LPLKIPKDGSDRVDFLFGKLRIDRKRQTLLTQHFSNRKVASSVTEMRVSFLEVNRHRIMNGTLDLDILQGGADAIALWTFNHITMPDAL